MIRYSIRNRMMQVVIGSILLVLLPGMFWIKHVMEQRSLTNHQYELLVNLQRVSDRLENYFLNNQKNLLLLNELIELELAAPASSADLAQFEKTLQRYPDGYWRIKPELFDGQNEVGGIIPDAVAQDPKRRIEFIRIKRVLDRIIKIVPNEAFRVYTKYHYQMIYAPLYPQFTYEEMGTLDQRQEPWFLASTPEQNPLRQFNVTSPTVGKVGEPWMFTSISPLYVNGEWLGTSGLVLLLDELQQGLNRMQQFAGTEHFIFNDAHQFILATHYQDEIYEAHNPIALDFADEPALKPLFEQKLRGTPRLLAERVKYRDKIYLAYGVRIPRLEWNYVLLVPIDAILALPMQAVDKLLNVIQIAYLLVIILILVLGRNTIFQRLVLLRQMLHDDFVSTEENNALASERGMRLQTQHDEIATVAQAITKMKERVLLGNKQQKKLEAELRSSEYRLAVAMEAAGEGIWDLNYVSGEFYRSPQMVATLGYQEGELITLADWDAVTHPDDLYQLREGIDAYLRRANPEEHYREVVRMRHKQGHWVWILSVGKAIFDAQGQPLRFAGTHQDVSEEQEAMEALAYSEERFNKLFSTMSEAVLIHDPEQGKILDLNEKACQLFGLDRDEALQSTIYMFWGKSSRALRDEAKGLIKRALSGEVVQFEWLVRNDEGEVFPIEMSMRALVMGKEIKLISVIRDLREFKHEEAQLQNAGNVFSHALEGIMITDSAGVIVDVNEALIRITGYSKEEFCGQKSNLLKSGRHDERFFQQFWNKLLFEGRWSGEVYNRYKDGSVHPNWLNISAVYDDQGVATHYVSILSDITELKHYEHQLEQMAHYDALTGLANRVLLADRITQGMLQADRHQQQLAVIFIDLDGFKKINDQHGHDMGDHLLVTVSQRMKAVLREVDTLARIGGDEFVAVLVELSDRKASESVIERLLAAACEPVLVDDRVLCVSASIGVTFYPQGEEISSDQLLRQADQAMYQAKTSGKNRYQIFSGDLETV